MRRVLVADDTTQSLEYLRVLLSAHRYSVSIARNGIEALSAAREAVPDVIVSDLLMPQMDGYQLLREWKADPRLAAVPFVVYTGTYTEASDEDLAREMGADAFIRKPAEPAVFLEALEAVLARNAAVPVAGQADTTSGSKASLRLYSEALVRKLEERTIQLEAANRDLYEDATERQRVESALRESERELRQLTEAMPQIVWIARPDGFHVHFNRQWMEYTGLTLEESLGQGWLPPFHPDDRPRAAERWAEATRSGEQYEIEYRLRRADGEYRWMLGRALPLRDAAGAIIKWFGTLTDIDDLKKAEQAINAAQRQHRLVLESVGEGIHGLDRRGLIVFENPAASAKFGWSLDEMRGREAHALIHHHKADGSVYPVEECPIHLTLQDGEVRRVEGELFFRRDGGSFPVEYVSSPVRDESGAITGAVVSFRDVTEQRAARKLLEEQAALLRIAGKVARLGGWIIRLPERELVWSDENCAIHDCPPGYRPTLEEGINYYLPEDRAAVRKYVEDCVDYGIPYDFELPKRTAKGRLIWVRSIGAPVRDAEGKVIRLEGAFQDISERKAAEDALRQRDALIRIAGKVTRTGGWALTLPDRQLFWSDEVFDILGFPRGTAPSLEDALRLFLPPWHEEVEKAIELCAESAIPFDLEVALVTTAGERLWARIAAEAERGADGGVQSVQGAFQDISERKHSEEALKESENELRALAESMPQMVWITRADGWNIYFNQRWVDYTGLTLEESYGHGWVKPFHPDDQARSMEAWQRAVENTSEYNLEGRIRRADGEYRWMLVRGLPFRDQSGRVVKWMGTCTDIHDLKQANSTLREQASLLDKAQDAIVVRDLDHRILYWNRSAERLYGYTAEEAIGENIVDLLYRDPTAFFAAFEEVLRRGEWVGEIAQFTKGEQKIIVEGHWSLVTDDDGKPRAILAINTDITARKQLEAQFLRAQRLESIGTLAGGIAHDFNNLLAPLLMGIGYLQRVETRENVLAVIRNMERSVSRGKELVKQVLSFAKGVDGARGTIQLAHIIREVESIVESTFPKTIRFEQHIAEDLDLVDGDPTQLNQVLLNLCVNARDAMPAGGRLQVRAENVEIDEQYAVMNRGVKPGSYVMLSVSDDGSGIPPEIVDRVFEPFFTTKEFGKGTGLGLSTVLGIVQSHGGFVNVASELGKGSEFKVYLPARPADAGTGAPMEAAEALPRGNGELVLLVDDEVPILDVTRQTLEAFGYRVLVAEDGAQAIALYADHHEEVAVVITDMMMPIMNGAALIFALRRMNPGLRIIAASGMNAELGASGAGTAGVRHFLSKPYSADRLLVLLRTVLAEPADTR